MSVIAAEASWLLKALGLGDDIPSGAKPHFEWANPLHSWAALALLTGALLLGCLVWALYKREIDTCPRSVKRLLAVVRCLVLLLLVLIFLGPSLTYTSYRTRHAQVVVLRDASQSMNTSDEYPLTEDASRVAAGTGWTPAEIRRDRPSRAKIVDRLLTRDNQNFLDQLQRHGKVRIIDFDQRPREVEIRPVRLQEDQSDGNRQQGPAIATLTALNPEGRSSNLYLALEEALTADPLAAVVVFTDGQRTDGNDLRQLADQAKKRGAPFFIVGVGDPQPGRNLAVSKVFSRKKIWQDEPFSVEAVLKSEGFDQRDVRVELIEQQIGDDGKPGPERMVRMTTATLPADGGQVKATLEHSVGQAGDFLYSVRVESLAGERKLTDNRLSASPVKVLDREKIRVLLISGAPSWEYRMLQRLLTRDKTISLSCWLQTLDIDRPQEGNVPISKLPETRQDLFAYDVVMMLDPNPREFDDALIDLLKQFASQHAGGIFYMAGPKYSGDFLTGNRTGTFRSLLPIRFGDVGATQVAALLSSNRTAWPLRIVSHNADHQVMSFYSDRQESLARWQSLPGIFWSFPARETKPTSQVLIEHSDPTLRRAQGPRPLLVAGRYGSGNTVYQGFNGTWRWRRVGRQAEFFDRFWINVVRFLAESRSLEGNRHGVVQTDLDRYEIGARVVVTARLTDDAYQPLNLDEVTAVLQVEQDPPVEFILKKIADREGQYEAVLTTRRVGEHTIRIRPPQALETPGEGSDDEPDAGAAPPDDALEAPAETETADPTAEPAEEEISASFMVELPRVETRQVWLNKPLLTDLAQASGGRYFDVDEYRQIVAAIPDASETIEVQGKPRMLWSTWPVLVLLSLLLCLEWSLRKAYKLL